MVPPRFHDQGVRFTVRVPNHTLLAAADLRWLAELRPSAPLNDIQRHAAVAMRHGIQWTNKSLRDAFPMDSLEARNVLAGLVDAGVAEAIGERGGRVYQLSGNLQSAKPHEQPRLPIDEDRPDSDTVGLPSLSRVEAPGSGRARGARRINAETIARYLINGPAPMSDIQQATSLSERQASYALHLLKDEGRVVLQGGQGDRNSKWALIYEGGIDATSSG